MTRKKPSKEFSSTWIFEPFDRDPTFFQKPMFGCLAAYVRGRLVMVLAEDPGDREYRGKKYPYDIWNGVMIPTEKEHHASLIREFESLIPHPVLGKWLYLPVSDENFEILVRDLSEKIARGDSRFGVEPQVKFTRKSG